jgi:hypothetical protein
MSKLLKAGAIICSAVLCSLVYSANAWAQNYASEIRYIRFLEMDDFFDVVNLDGMVFPPRTNSILVLDQPRPGAGTIILVPKGGRPGDRDSLSQEISDPINITFDDLANRLFLFERESKELVVIKLIDQLRSPNAIQRFKAEEVGVKDPSGMAVDPKTGTLFILDRFGPKIVQVDFGPNRENYEGAAALEEGRISEFFLQQSQGRRLRGLGFNHTDGCLYVFSTNRQELYKINEDSELVSVGVLSGFDTIDPKGFVFAPSLDQTDDAGQMHLYIASSGGSSGQVTEWSLTPCVQRRGQ